MMTLNTLSILALNTLSILALLIIATAAFLCIDKKTGIYLICLAVISIILGAIWKPTFPSVIAGCLLFLISAGLIGYCFRAVLQLVLPNKLARFFGRAPLTASFGMFIAACTLFICVFAGAIAPYGEAEIIGDIWEASSSTYLLGTDNLGRDMFSRLVYGARTTIIVAVAASVLSFSMGIIQGFATAVIGGWLDQVLSRINDLLLAIPTLVFALVVLAALPQNLFVLIAVMAIIDQTRVFRLGRAVAMDVVVQDFVEAAQLRGEKWHWIVFKEVLPNVLTPLIAEFGLRFAYAILFLSSLSFLGLGIQPPQADWGSMVKDNKDGLIFLVPAALYPGFAIALLAVSVNMVVDWLLNRTASLKGGRS